MKILIFGCKQLFDLAKFYFEEEGHNIVASCVDKDYIAEDFVSGVPVVSFDEIENHFPPDEFKFFCPLSSNSLRFEKYNAIKQKGYSFTSYVSTKANIFTKTIGENCFILESNTIQPFCKIGDNNILWSGNHVGHHSVIKNHNFITSHVTIGGNCTVNNGVFIGMNATIKDGTSLGDWSFITMGADVIKNVKENEKIINNNLLRKK